MSEQTHSDQQVVFTMPGETTQLKLKKGLPDTPANRRRVIEKAS